MSNCSEFKFIADENVGRLVKNLRILGFDTVYFKDAADSRLVEIARMERRIILTRDTHIQQRKAVVSGLVRSVLIRSDRILEQMQQLIHELELSRCLKPFTLCLECNYPLVQVDAEEVETRVPPYVFKTQKEFAECPQCRRIYWKGTHYEAMQKRLLSLQ